MQTLQQAIKNAVQHCDDEACGDSGLSFRPSYSGRGMYGRKCVGVSGSMGEIMQLIAHVIQEAHEAEVDAVRMDNEALEIETHNFAQDAVTNLLDFSQDSMGNEVIIYWPQLESV